MPSQQSLPDFVQAMDAAGFLVRITDEIRVDQIPKTLEANPTKAVLIEKIKDCEFSVLANAYSKQAVLAAMAFRYMPDRDTVIIKDCNTIVRGN
jgi:2,5-furandicarboxylate decarboxylase 1